MAQLQTPFNAYNVDPTQGGSFNQLPVGNFLVVARASEVKPNSANTGGMVVFDLEVIDGPNKGATGVMRINLYNASDAARKIAESQMSALCYATGVMQPHDTAALHNIPFGVVVENQPLTADQQAKKDSGQTVTPFTQVAKILNSDGTVPGMQGNAPAQSPAPTPQAPAPQQAAQGGGWNQGNAPAPQQSGGWQNGGNSQPSAPPPPAAAPAANNGWAQNNQQAGGKPAWGK